MSIRYHLFALLLLWVVPYCVCSCKHFALEVSNSDGFLRVLDPISTPSETASEFIASFPVVGAPRDDDGTSMIAVHENLSTCERSLVILHDNRGARDESVVIMEISGKLSQENSRGDDESTSASYSFDSFTHRTTVTWDLDADSTFGLEYSVGPGFHECITISPYFVSGIETWSFVQENEQEKGGYSFENLKNDESIDVCFVVFEPPPTMTFCEQSTSCSMFNLVCRLRQFLRCRI